MIDELRTSRRPLRASPCALRTLHVALAILMALFVGTPAALADSIDDVCMQDTAGFALNCTANDVQIARATNIVIDDPCDFPGDEVTFTATFEVLLTAQGRHDIGIYFAIDGDDANNDGVLDGDGALLGKCSISTVAYQPDPLWLDLDGISDGGFCANDANIFCESDRDCRSVGGVCDFEQDLCGDIDDAHNPLYPVITITAECVDSDGDGNLNLPYCTSWRQPGANELCLTPLDAYPGAPSKCRCDIGFNVPVPVPSAELLVSKTAIPTQRSEPGGPVTYDVSVTNIGIDPNNPVTLNSLTDNIYGAITQAQGDITSTDCSVPQTIPSDDGNPGGIDTYTCQFTANVSGNANDLVVDTVTASGVDARGNSLSGSDDATVTIVGVNPRITVDKTANPTQVLEPGEDVDFTVVVTNTSVSSDPVTITSLTDTIYGDLNGQGDCSVPQTIQPGDSYTCTFSAFVAGDSGDSETDTVTASGTDDDGNSVSGSDDATVNVNDVPSSIELIKTVSPLCNPAGSIDGPACVDEPGGDVTFTFTINNTSLVDSITINSLTDTIYGDLNGQGDCSVPQTIAALGSYSCSFTALVQGNGGDSETNTATASGLDDDGNPVSENDSATVNIVNVAPTAMLTKTPEAQVTFTVVVTNTSVSTDPLTLTVLHDDIYGDLTDNTDEGGAARPQVSTTCSLPQTIEPGDFYECEFQAIVQIADSPQTDTVTGTVSDDESTAVSPSPSDSATVTLE